MNERLMGSSRLRAPFPEPLSNRQNTPRKAKKPKANGSNPENVIMQIGSEEIQRMSAKGAALKSLYEVSAHVGRRRSSFYATKERRTEAVNYNSVLVIGPADRPAELPCECWVHSHS